MMKNTVIFVCATATFFMFASFAFAQSYTPLAPLPGTYTGDAGSETTNLSLYLSGAIKLLIALGAGLSILVAIIGGTQYVAAGISPDAKSGAKERITNALIGLTLVLVSYLILNSINPNLVSFNFMLPPVGTSPMVPTTSTGGVHIPPVKKVTQTVVSEATSAGIQTINTTNTPTENLQTTIPGISVDNFGAMIQNTLNTYINRGNDYSIISHCFNNTIEPLCGKTDLNNDGVTNSADLGLFSSKGSTADVNGNNRLELENLATPVSCFFKISTATSTQVASTTPPRYSSLGGVCAKDSGYINMPFGFVYGANGDYPGEAGESGQYSNFKIWIESSLSGSAVNLRSLLSKTFYNRQIDYDYNVNPYYPNVLGKITYATIAQYNLNDDGVADFGASGADRTVFNSCKGAPVADACAQADFNGDGIIDDRDLSFSNDLFSGPGLAFGWKLDWFESRFFDPTGYTDKQIINYCIGHKAFEKCGSADVNRDGVVDSADLAEYNTSALLLDFNSDGVVDLH
ncbi:MAG TPA: hypothetical protein DCS23_00120 [Candidatus Yonathbacteria bacterium]|nr:hypothetical protein [Candidatus Yonathbacteria bacterium]